MHELSVCRALLRQVQAVAAAPACSVTVRIGPLSGVDADLLARAWRLVGGDMALQIERVPLRVRCGCGAESVATPQDLTCRVCGDWRTTLLSGDEMLLVRVTVEEGADV